jgi:hypothetical protein
VAVPDHLAETACGLALNEEAENLRYIDNAGEKEACATVRDVADRAAKHGPPVVE